MSYNGHKYLLLDINFNKIKKTNHEKGVNTRMRLIQTAILVGLVGLGVYYFNDIYEFLKNNLQISYGIIVAFALVTLRVVFPILWKTVLAGFFVWLSTRMSWSNIWTILFNLVVLAGAVATIVLQILQIRALLNAG